MANLWGKTQRIISLLLFSLLAIFFICTCWLGLQNYPAARFALILSTVLIWLCMIWPAKTALENFHPLKDFKALTLLGLITLIPRALWLASVQTQQISDFMLYHRLASSLAADSIRFQAYIRLFPHVITYPFVLSILYRLFGSAILIAQVFNLFLFVGIVLTIFLLASTFLDRRFAFLTALIVALWPSQIFYTTMVSTEALFTLLLLLSIGLFYSIRNIIHLPKGMLLFGLLGIAVAITNAVRPFGPLFLTAVFIYYFVFVSLELRGSRLWFVKLILFGFVCLGYFITLNLIHYLVVRTVQGSVAKTFLGYSILAGANIDSGGSWNEEDSLLQTSIYQNGEVSPDKVNQILFGYAIERIRSSPGEFLYLQLTKNKTMWQDDSFGINLNKTYRDDENPGFLSLAFMERVSPISNTYYYTILICCILGSLIGTWKRETGLITFIGLVIFGTIFIFLFTEVQERYHYYVLPLFALLAGYGLGELNHVYQKRRQLKA